MRKNKSAKMTTLTFRSWLLLLFFGLQGVVWCVNSTPMDSIDVEEGENVVLKCRFPPELSTRGSTLYWIRTNRRGHDNVAIGETPFQASYKVDHRPQEGIYDLSISQATYDRDNGDFECRMKEGGTGNEFYSKSVQLTVLLMPSPPTILSVDPTVTEGKTFNLTCESKGGSPAPEIKWFLAGKQLDAPVIEGWNKDVPTKAVLTINPRKEDDGSSYKCTVWNRALGDRKKFEASTKIYVNYFPRVQVGPENPLKVEKDDTATLQCTVDAKPSVKEVRWARNGRFISTNFNYSIPQVTLQSSGSYMCSAENGLGQNGKSELKLDVLYAPVVSLPPRREVKEGEDVAIDCQVEANPRPTSIQWFRVGHDQFMQNGPTLRLRKVSAKDNGAYICSASNFLQPTGKDEVMRTGNATIEINIRHQPGKATITPDSPTAVVGNPIVIKCSANPPGYPEPKYRWWKEGSEQRFPDSSELRIDNARLNSAGNYFCQPTNEMGDGTRANVRLEVNQAPKIITNLKPTIVKRSGDAGFQITCSAVGKPKPNIRWFKDGNEIIDDNSMMYHIIKQETKAQGVNMAYNVQSTLRYIGKDRISDTHLMYKDRGHYTCQFENEVAKAETTMFLRIEHSPRVVHQHNKVAFDIGDTAYISCKMLAYPQPHIDWSFRNSHLQNDPNLYNSNISVLDNDVYEGVLRINKVTELSYGRYTCKGSNQIGNKRTIIELQKRGKPEAPTNVRPVMREYNSILVGWDNGFDGGYNTTKYIVQYKKHGHSKTLQKNCEQRNPCNLTGLDQFSQYHVMVMASNDQGNSKYSKDVVLNTRVDVGQIPKPQEVHYAKSNRMVSFHVKRAGFLPLYAQIELRTTDDEWAPYHILELGDASLGEMEIQAPVTDLRVKFCLKTEEVMCGKYGEAKIVDILPSRQLGALGKPWVIAVVVLGLVVGLVAVVLMAKCCCCRNSKPSKKEGMGKERPTIIHSTQPPFGHGQGGIENKGVDTLKDADEILKNNLYQQQQSGHPYDGPGGHQSTSNSANGGSVNSQDSLWNVKGAENNAALLALQQQQQQAHYPQGNYQAYDQMAVMQQQYQAQQQHQQQIPPQGYPDEYAHYPYPDEYLNERNQQFLANNVIDAYGRQRQQRLESDYSPYGDVSGLPDPYHGGQYLEEPQTPTQATAMQNNGHMSFEDAVDGTGMTPNSRSRRIIREIIV